MKLSRILRKSGLTSPGAAAGILSAAQASGVCFGSRYELFKSAYPTVKQEQHGKEVGWTKIPQYQCGPVCP